MICIIAKSIKVFSQPLGEIHKHGYDAMAKRVCQIESKKKRWTGFAVVSDHVITTGFFPHGREFDVEFYGGVATAGFLTEDWGEVIEIGVGKVPKLDGLYTQSSHVTPGQVLFVIGSILGIPYTLASCEVEKVLIVDHVMTDERLALLDEHSSGSPVFNAGGSLVGILEAYIEKTDRMIIRSLISNAKGLMKG